MQVEERKWRCRIADGNGARRRLRRGMSCETMTLICVKTTIVRRLSLRYPFREHLNVDVSNRPTRSVQCGGFESVGRGRGKRHGDMVCRIRLQCGVG